MGWESSNRKYELPAGWERLRRETLEADNYRCVWPGRWAARKGVRQCGEPATDVDHIRDRHDHSAGNRQSLCRYHHNQKTAKESAAALAVQRAKLTHPGPAKHPGLK